MSKSEPGGLVRLRGFRVMPIEAKLIATVMMLGLQAHKIQDVPDDLEVCGARFEETSKTVELLVSSGTFWSSVPPTDAPSWALLWASPKWAPVARRGA